MKKIFAKIFLDCSYPLIVPLEILSEFLKSEFENQGMEDADRYKVEFTLLTDEEYKELEEHKGW